MDIKKKSEKLYAAIGEINGILIEEANKPNKAIIPSGTIKPAAIAAALIILTVSIPVIINLFTFIDLFVSGSNAPVESGDSMNGAASAPMSPGESQEQISLYTDGASLTLLNKANGIYTFELIIEKEQEEINVTVRGEGTDEFGEAVFVISTTADYAELTHIPKAAPVIKINGDIQSKIPNTEGEYVLTVDLSGLDSEYNWNNYFTVTPFGNISR